MKTRSYGFVAVGFLAVIVLVLATAGTGHAWQQPAHPVGGPRVVIGARVVVPTFHVAPRFVGPRVFVGVPYVYPYPAYYPYYYPAYAYPPAPPAYPEYVERDAVATGGWYYCQSPAGYYPNVPQCPGGWIQVAPGSSGQ